MTNPDPIPSSVPEPSASRPNSIQARYECVSELTLGLLHRLSNVLTGIYFNIDVCQEAIPEDHPASEALAEVSQATQEIQQLLERLTDINLYRQEEEPTYHELGSLISQQIDLIRILLPKTTHVETRHASASLHISAIELDFRTVTLLITRLLRKILPHGNSKIIVQPVLPENVRASELLFHPRSNHFISNTTSTNFVAVQLSIESIDPPPQSFQQHLLPIIHAFQTPTSNPTSPIIKELEEAQFFATKFGAHIAIRQTQSHLIPDFLIVIPEVDLNY